MINGMDIEFNAKIAQKMPPQPILFNDKEIDVIDEEIKQLSLKRVIVKTSHCRGEFISNIFIRPKKDGGHRLILNLKRLNLKVKKRRFKMQGLTRALNLMTKNCYMASIDWKDAYYTVPVDRRYQKLLRFIWKGQLWQFTCLPNGLSSGPRVFTKITKPIFSHLRKKGHLNAHYIDDSFLAGDSVDDCRANVIDTTELSRSCGFIVHPTKSVFEPTQQLTYLGFILNSVTMTVSLPANKADSIQKACASLLKKTICPIQTVAELVGQMVGSFPGVEHGKLYYRNLDNDKTTALSAAKGNFDANMIISDQAKIDLQWWISNVHSTFKLISHGKPEVILQSDASNSGWGGVHGDESTGGDWSDEEARHHINYLELLAAWLTLKSYCKEMSAVHVQILLDNTTAVAYINNQGGRKSLCNSLARQIWEWAIDRDLWLTASHLPGVLNVEADRQSRISHRNTEWKLKTKIFQRIATLWGTPNIDLFASRLNYQLKPYVSWHTDPEAIAVDAFTMTWHSGFYAFPPFTLLSKVIAKIQEDECDGILVAPFWTTQSWFSKLSRMLIDCPFLLPRSDKALWHPQKQTVHPLKKMTLAVFRLSGNTSKASTFRRTLQNSLCRHGDYPRADNTNRTSGDGWRFVVKGVQIHSHHLLDWR